MRHRLASCLAPFTFLAKAEGAPLAARGGGNSYWCVHAMQEQCPRYSRGGGEGGRDDDFTRACATPLQVIAQLQDKNEELALKAAKISEQELEDMRAEFEKRLGAAERKVCGGLWCTVGRCPAADKV